MPKPTVSTTFNAVNKMKGPMQKMSKSVRTFARGATIAIGAVSVGFGAMIREASKIEDAVAGFTPLMGGAEKANELVEKLNQTAATTPFQFANIAKSAGQLLPVMNQDIEKTVETFRMLGDTAGGNAQKLDSITRGFTKAMLKGKVDLESLNMIAEAGVPVFSELSKELGVSSKEMFKMVSAGKVTTDQLTATFRTMTTEGGVFFNGMEIASKTLTGKLSTLKDNIALTAGSIGMQLLPTIKPLIDKAIQIAGKMREWVTANQELINQKVQDFIAGITRAGQILYKMWDSGLIPGILAGVAAFKVLTGIVTAYKTAVIIAKGAQLAFNLAMAGNPVGLIIVAVSALIALLVALQKKFQIFTKIRDAFKSMPQVGGAGGGQQAQAALMGRNDNVVRSQTVTGNWQGNLNIKGLPQGSTMESKGSAIPGVNLNYGYGQGGL